MEAITAILFAFGIISFVIYYFVLIMTICENKYSEIETKKQALFYIIPYSMWVHNIIKGYNKLD